MYGPPKLRLHWALAMYVMHESVCCSKAEDPARRRLAEDWKKCHLLLRRSHCLHDIVVDLGPSVGLIDTPRKVASEAENREAFWQAHHISNGLTDRTACG